MRGRKPVPTAFKELRGTLRKHRVRNEPQPDLGIPNCPPWLDATARAAWDELVPLLSGMRVLTPADGSILAATVDAFSEFRSARAVIEERGATYSVQTESGEVWRPLPEVAIRKDAWSRYVRGLTELGLSPSARGRVSAVGGKKGANEFDVFDGGPRFGERRA